MNHRRFFILLAVSLTVAFQILNSQVGRRSGLIDPNIASEKELAAIPHLNESLVKGIVERRPFLATADLNAFLKASLDSSQLANVYKSMFLSVNLNTVSREEILMIPGAGRRMVREFLEYRPYKALAQFRKEIGKYVDEKELARLEQYVFVPINLNNASDEDILSIPGMGPRMLREFKEYRPYKNIEQFRKEMGKYVGPKEVSHYERYVTVE
jgi:DNA uptake protein ComE-like DNA-binding protein